jgi:hypothetical protein
MVFKFRKILVAGIVIYLFLVGCKLTTHLQDGKNEEAKTTTASIDSAGGAIELNDLKVVVGKNNLMKSTAVTIEEMIPTDSEDGEITVQSSTYHLRDLPSDFSGNVQITFTIPDEVLEFIDRSDPDRAKKIVLMLGEDSYSRTGGGLVNLFAPMLDAEVDIDSKQVTTQIDFSGLAKSDAAQKMAAPNMTEWWETTPKNLYFKVVGDVFWNSTRNGNFSVYFPNNTYAGSMVDALIEAQSKVESLGLQVGPLPVYLEKPGNMDGLFSWSMLRGYYMAINPSLLESGMERSLRVTVGHELMHYAQLLTYQDQGDWDTYNSLDEAIAIWFESYVLSDPNYVNELADEHILTFLYNPWFSGSDQETRRAGYGASWYVHYLTNLYGTDFVTQAYNGNHVGGKASWALGVLDAYGINNDLAFRQFLSAFVIHANQVSPALAGAQHYDDVFERRVVLEELANGPVAFTAWENGIPTDAETGFGSSEGTIVGSPLEYTFDPEPEFSISRTLSPWNGYYIFLRVVPSLYPFDEGQLDVDVSTTERNSGVMLYAIPKGGDESNAVALNGPEDYLASETKDFAIVDSISSTDGGGEYSGIVLILFNSGDQESSIALNVTFAPAKPAVLRGEAIATSWTYPENTCDLDCCYPFTDPPECVSQAGGGAGGDGDSNEACNKPCPVVPEWCYWCSDRNGATSLINLAREYNPPLEIVVDADGEVSVSYFHVYGDPGEPISHSSSNGSFQTEWVIDDFNGNPNIHLTMRGNANASSGSGTWTLSYDGIGEMVSGTWSAAP